MYVGTHNEPALFGELRVMHAFQKEFQEGHTCVCIVCPAEMSHKCSACLRCACIYKAGFTPTITVLCTMSSAMVSDLDEVK